MAFGFQFQSVASAGPELMQTFQLSYADLGTLVGLYMAPGILVALPGGVLGRRFGERPVVGAGLLLMTLGSGGAAFAASPAGIGLSRIVAGSGAVTLIVMQGTMVSDRFAGRRFMPVMGLLTGAFPVGAGLAGLVHPTLSSAFGWPGMFVAGAAIAGVAFLLFALSCGPSLRRGGAGLGLPSRRECGLVIVAGLIWTAFNAGYYGFLSYVPSLLAVRGHPPELSASVLLLATWTQLPATIAGGALATRYGNWAVFLFGTCCGVVAVAGPAILDWPFVWGALFGLGGSLQAGVIIAVGTLSARPENRAVGMGLFYTAYYLGGTVFPALCGRAADVAGTPAAAMLTAAALGALAIPTYRLHQWLQRR